MRKSILDKDILQNKYVDRRERLRFKAKANCSFRSFDPTLFYNEYNICKIENIGTGGLAFISDQKWKLKTRLFLTIALCSYDTEDPIDAVGEVIWVHSSKFPKKYRIGVKFVHILKDDLLALTRQLN